jgi:outer membrane lipoprotein-sorting protein
MRRIGAKARWTAPVGAIAIVGIVAGATAAASAGTPALPGRTVEQLLVAAQQALAKPQGPLTATIQETANLGLPALSTIGEITNQTGRMNALTPLAGTTTISIWCLNQRHIRIAEQAPMGERDLRLNGNQLWLWDSRTQTATHVVLPAQMGKGPSSGAPPFAPGGGPTLTPQQAARQALAAVGPSTRVSLGANTTVAGRPAYQIELAPKSSGSLISQVVIAIDAARHIPLQVTVDARGQSSPAFQIGFTALSFGPPAMSNFSFTPPPGAHVKTVHSPATPAGLNALGPIGVVPGFVQVGGGPACASLSGARSSASPTGSGPGPGQVQIGCGGKSFRPGLPPIPPKQLRRIEAQFIKSLPKDLPKARRAAIIKQFDAQLTHPGNAGIAPMTPMPSPFGPIGPFGAGGPRVLGKDWTTVIATPASPAVAQAVHQLLTGPDRASAQTSMTYGSSSSQAVTQSGSGSQPTYSRVVVGSPGPIPAGPGAAVLRALLQASAPVHGSWGSGRLLRSALLSVLITSKGQILAGPVEPSVLYADAAKLAG